MKFTSVLATVLAGTGLASASRCKPSPVSSASSVSSVVSSSSVISASASSSSYVAPAPTCGPDSTAMGGGTDIANSGSWAVHNDAAYNVDTSISTCHGSPTNDCLTFAPSDSGQDMTVFFTYKMNVVVGVTYTYTFQFTQDTSEANEYAVYTSNTGEQVNVVFTAGMGNWQTATLTVTPTLSVTNLNVLGSVSAGTTVTFGNFAIYENCQATP